MSWLLLICILSLLFLLIRRSVFYTLEGIRSSWVLAAFFIKILASVVLLMIYTYIYPERSESDIFKYFDDAKVLASLIQSSPADYVKILSGIGELSALGQERIEQTLHWDKSPSVSFFADNRLIIRFNALIYLFSMGNIWTHMLLSAFIGFSGLLMLFKAFQPKLLGKEKLFFILLFTMPSILLWTSGPLKDTLMIFGLGGFFLHFLKIFEGPRKMLHLLMILLFGALIVQSKLYVFIAILPVTFAYYWDRFQSDGKTFYRYATSILLAIGIGLNLSSISPNLDIVGIVINKQSEFKCLAEWVGAGSVIYIPDLSYHFKSFLIAAPYALYNALLRPGIFDVNSILSALSFLEIYLMWLIVIVCTLNRRKDVDRNLLYFAISFILLLSLIVGLTTPVLGAMVRYRIPCLLFLLLLSIHLLSRKKLNATSNIFKPIQ